MTIKRIFSVFIVLVMSSQFAFANYGFYLKVKNTCKYYSVTVDEKKMSRSVSIDSSFSRFTSLSIIQEIRSILLNDVPICPEPAFCII